MSETLRSILIGTAGLTIAGVAATFVTIIRGRPVADATSLHRAVRAVVATVLVQGAHFTEETATGFYQRFPELLGLAPWPSEFFVWFNLTWLAIWLIAAWGLAARRWVALFPLWFLGIASVANGIAHPLLSLAVRGYFPGLVTSPFVGAAGILVLRRLAAITRNDVKPGRT